jgi:hypothetical protein
MDKTTCHDDSPPFNICNPREVDQLATALHCLATDLYEAVAFVGDSPCCIRSYIEKRFTRDSLPRALIKLCDLPPVWEDEVVTHAA